MPQELTWPSRRRPGWPRALLIDVGFTLTVYDGATVARIAAAAGLEVDAAAVDATEFALRAEFSQHAWPLHAQMVAPAAGGARFMRRLLELASPRAAAETLDAAAERLWSAHLKDNLWFRILPGVEAALDRAKAAGLKLAALSNAEGTVEAMLIRTGLAQRLDHVQDSWHVGVAKPDPRFFALALGKLGVAAADAAMVGDSPAADVDGAHAAGVRAALIDPADLHVGRYPVDLVPRFPTFAAFVDDVLRV